MKNSLQRMLFGKLDNLVEQLENRYGEEFKELARWEKDERAMRFYNSQKTMIQQYRFLIDLFPWLLAAWALCGK